MAIIYMLLEIQHLKIKASIWRGPKWLWTCTGKHVQLKAILKVWILNLKTLKTILRWSNFITNLGRFRITDEPLSNSQMQRRRTCKHLLQNKPVISKQLTTKLIIFNELSWIFLLLTTIFIIYLSLSSSPDFL